MRSSHQRIILAALLSSCSLLVHANKTITFNVPVKLEKMDPQVNGVFVMCNVYGTGPNIAFNIGKSNIDTPAPVVNQAYTGIISIPITIPAADVGKASGWSCTLRLTTASQPTGAGLNLPGSPWTTVAPGSVGQVSGNF